MEMNTRLQVEHPVTEAITGLDLVELQLRVAAGEPLPFAQDDLSIDGHAFEARLYAEDAEAGFLPATGRLTHLAFPDGTAFSLGSVRIDAGVRKGDEITPHYDPMIAKLIVHGPDRATALRQLSRALGETEVAGTTTNLGFLKRLADHEGFAAGQVDTGLIARDLDTLTTPDTEKLTVARQAAALAALGMPSPTDQADPWDKRDGWRLWGTASHRVTLSHQVEPQDTEVKIRSGASFEVDGVEIHAFQTQNGLQIVSTSDATLGVFADEASVTVFDDGTVTRFDRVDPLDRTDTSSSGGDVVRAPMPGLVTQVRVAAGDTVEADTPLMTLEAMKMEHTLRSPRSGIIAEVLASTGSQVENGAMLVRLESEDE